MEVIADALVSVSTGPVVSTIVIDVDCGEAVSVVCAFPVVSVIENELAAAIVAVAVSPTKVAVEIAVIVQTVGDVWTIPDNEVIPVKVKSVPLVVERPTSLKDEPYCFLPFFQLADLYLLYFLSIVD